MDRFPQRFDANWSYNVLGYGAGNPWIPPLYPEPETLLGMIDRHIVTSFTMGPIMYFCQHLFWTILTNTYNGDVWDGYLYNNT